ncbi:MAG: NPCBM/NEW2 domain-containing protein, partial [Phycisphaerae bacterium]|nr:NPCBM/NEW2 domain-containing protein [Phycisphaerae bacterium]
VKQYGFFDEGFPYRVNRSVGGGPLRLGGRVYQTGLGLHSYAKLTYKLNGAYMAFVAVVGIDESVHPNGDARLIFLGDGKELIPKLRLTGKDKPQAVRMKLKGVRNFTIQVGFGADELDVSDHVNVAAARLIK